MPILSGHEYAIQQLNYGLRNFKWFLGAEHKVEGVDNIYIVKVKRVTPKVRAAIAKILTYFWLRIVVVDN